MIAPLAEPHQSLIAPHLERASLHLSARYSLSTGVGMRLVIGFCVLCFLGLPAATGHAGEVVVGAVGSASSEPISTSDVLRARLETEVLRYYSGIGVEPTKEQVGLALKAARNLLLDSVSLSQLSALVNEAIERHEGAEVVPFSIAVSYGHEARTKQAAEKLLRDRKTRREKNAEKLLGDREKGKRLMTAAFVAQGISLGVTFASMFTVDVMFYSWVPHAITIPFAPMGVEGFALRYGSSSETERLRWTGIGLLEAAAFAAVIGGVTAAALAMPGWGQDLTGIFAVPGMISHFGASIAFLIAGGSCLAVAKAQVPWKGMSQSSRSPASPPHRGFVVPTFAPRHSGLSLGLVGVFYGPSRFGGRCPSAG